MPNWCECAVIITGEGADEVLDLISQHETLFAGLLPRPAAFDGLYSGAITLEDGTRVELWREGPDGEKLPVSAEERDRLFNEYGADNWYDWSNANWGTKWDPGYKRDGNCLRFSTAWAPPIEFFATISERFPLVHFELGYSEGGMAYWGTAVIDNGVVEDHCNSMGFWTDEDDEDDDVLFPGVTDEVRAHLLHYGIGTGG